MKASSNVADYDDTCQNHNNISTFESHRLSCLLRSLHREIESERRSNKLMREKLWFKQQFAIGVNEVTRLLERMPASLDTINSIPQVGDSLSLSSKGLHHPYTYAVKLQAVLVASDCNPKWLSKHLLTLTSCKNVPLILVKDRKEGSLRLGELVKVKTAIALGIKAKGSGINRFLHRVVQGDELVGELNT